MEVIFQEKTNYSEWKKFLSSDNASNLWAYTLSFYKQCGVDLTVKDFSFAVEENNKIIAICPLFVTKDNNGNLEISDDGGYLRSPIVLSELDYRKKEKVLDFIFDKIEEISLEYKISTIKYLLDPQPGLQNANPFLKYGFINTSQNTQVLNLQETVENLRKDFRKSYKALVNKGLKTYEFIIMDSKNPDYQLHEKYRLMHKKAAGRETRDKSSFDLQFEQLKNDEATLIGVKYNGEFVQLNYFNHFNYWVYYASAADDPDFSETAEVPVGHSIMWFAIEHFKNRGFKFFELGYQYSKSMLFESPSNKELNISYFKRGFGGDDFSLYRGEKIFI